MLQSIRDRAQGWFAWLVLGAIAFVFTFWGVSGYLGAKNRQDTYVIKVNKQGITKQAVQDVYQRLASLWRARNPNIPPSEPLLKTQALQTLIAAEAVRQASVKNGYTISQQTIDTLLVNQSEFQVGGKFNPDLYQQTLNRAGFTPNQYQAMLTKGLLQDQLKNGFLATSYALKHEVETHVALINQTRDFDYAVLLQKNYLKKATVTDDEIKQYYNDNQQRFKTPRKVSLSYLLISKNDIKKQVKTTDKEVKQYYQDNQDRFAQPETRTIRQLTVTNPTSPKAQEKIAAIKAALKQKTDFSALVKKYSDDPIAAKKEGLYKDIAYTDLQESVAQQVFTLKNKNDISQPVVTDFGWQIFQLVSITPKKQLPFASVKANIQKSLVDDKVNKIFQEKAEKLQTLAFENTDTLEVAANQLKLPIKQTPLFSGKGGQGIAQEQSVLQAAFSDDVLEHNYNSDLLILKNGDAAVVRLHQDVKPSLLPLAQIKPATKEFLSKQKATSLAKADSEKILAALNQGESLAPLAKKYNLTWKKQSGTSRKAKDIAPAIVKAAFSTPKPNVNFENVAAVIPATGDVAVIRVTDSLEGTAKDSKEKAQIQQFTQINNARLGYQLYLDHLIKSAKLSK